MNIISVEESKSEIVTTDRSEYNIFRRYSPDSWENLMGDSWESYYYCDELEKEYQKFIAKGG